MVKTNKLIIGISTNFLAITNEPFHGYDRIFINSGYVDVIIQSGGIPLLLPMNADKETTNQLLELVDGVLLSGGQDVHPSYYSEEQHPLLGVTTQQRDEHELHIVRLAYEERKPILGVCRGLQLLNVHFGGTLYQDLSQHGPESKSGHSFDDHVEMTLHPVDIVADTLLHSILGVSELMTNSYHHQAVKILAPNFRVAARAKDGVIEAIENKGISPWIVGVQWHPEVMVSDHPGMKKLFQAFITEAQHYRDLREGLTL